MSKKSEKIEVGSVLKFKAYSETQKNPLFAPGDFVRVTAVDDDDGTPCWKVSAFLPKDKPDDLGYDPKAKAELVYEDEITLADEETAEEEYLENSDRQANKQTPYAGSGKSTKSESGKSKKKAKAGADTTTTEEPDTTTMKKTSGKKQGGAEPAGKKAVLGKGKVAKKTKGAKPKKEKKVKPPKPPTHKQLLLAKLELLPPVKDTASVTKAVKAAGGDPIKAINSLETTNKMSRWTLGGVLSKVKREKSFLKVGKDKYTDDQAGFEQFCEEHTDTGYRVAMMLIANFEHLSRVGADEEKCAAIPYHKLYKVLDVVEDVKTANLWLGKAADMTREDLVTEVKSSIIKSGGNGPKPRGIRETNDSMHRVTVKLFNDQKSVFDKAIEKAKKKMEGENNSDGAALAYILTDWMANSA
jgi:hypothetical protein